MFTKIKKIINTIKNTAGGKQLPKGQGMKEANGLKENGYVSNLQDQHGTRRKKLTTMENTHQRKETEQNNQLLTTDQKKIIAKIKTQQTH